MTIQGIATTPSTDRMGDIVEPLGAVINLPVPLLQQHDHNLPIGKVTSATPTNRGIMFVAKIPRITEPGPLRDRTEGAIQALQHGLLDAVSIGFRALPNGSEPMRSGGRRFTSWELLELSIVSVPANSEAVITSVNDEPPKTHKSVSITRRAPKPAKPKGRVVSIHKAERDPSRTITVHP